jgi:16S rRNA (cytidine1402-2'-O)-methyltransferase
MVLVVSGAIHEHKERPSDDEIAERAEDLMEAGVDRKSAMSRVAREAGVPRRTVFDALVKRRGTKP